MNIAARNRSILFATGILGIVVLLLVMFLDTGMIFGGSYQTAQVQAQVTKWHKFKPQFYSYVVRPGCFCPVENYLSYLVTVEKTGISTVVEDLWGPPYAGTQIQADRVMSIERIFRILSDALFEADEVRVEYDEEFGFPKFVYIDNYREITDDEFRIEVVDFKVVAGDI